MGNIFEDIVQDIEVKPTKSKLVLKWVVRIAVILITGAFAFGQIKMRNLNRLDDIEQNLSQLKQTTEQGFKDVNSRIDKVYEDGMKAFDDYQKFNKEQLLLIVDYGQTNKDLLKRILDINVTEKSKSVEMQLEQAKNETVTTPQTNNTVPYETKIRVTPVTKNKYPNLSFTVNKQTGDTTFILKGATKEQIDKINRNKYIVGDMVQNETNPYLFDVNYVTKKY